MLGLRGREKRRNRTIHLALALAIGLASSIFVFAGAASAQTHVVVSGPSSAVAGENVDICYETQDGEGDPEAVDAATSITFSSSPAATTTPAAETYAGGDNCGNNFVFNTAGTYTITVSASGTDASDPDNVALPIISDTWVVTVTAAEVDELVCSVPATAVAGVPFSFTITFVDEFGNTSGDGIEEWQTLEFLVTPEDAANVLPGTTFLTEGDGTYTFSATLWTSGAILVGGLNPGRDTICPGILVTAPAAAAPAAGAAAAGAGTGLPSFTG